MSEVALLLQPGFSVADAEYPSFEFSGDVLILKFTDWQERQVRVRFSNAAGVKWQELHIHGRDEQYDEVYEIAGSEWLGAYLVEARSDEDKLRHFRLNFNAVGTFEVLASSMEMLGADPS